MGGVRIEAGMPRLCDHERWRAHGKVERAHGSEAGQPRGEALRDRRHHVRRDDREGGAVEARHDERHLARPARSSQLLVDGSARPAAARRADVRVRDETGGRHPTAVERVPPSDEADHSIAKQRLDAHLGPERPLHAEVEIDRSVAECRDVLVALGCEAHGDAWRLRPHELGEPRRDRSDEGLARAQGEDALDGRARHRRSRTQHDARVRDQGANAVAQLERAGRRDESAACPDEDGIAERGTQPSERPRALPWERIERRLDDRFLCLDRTQGVFCYLLARALGARRVVEFGTSFGVSTIYLALAVRENGGGTVIGTEMVPAKARRARDHLREAGLEDLVEIREGDARETLCGVPGPVDLFLNDGFPRAALDVLRLVAPQLRDGAVVITDNVGLFPADYAGYVAWLRDPANGFVSAPLRMNEGTEMSVRACPATRS